MKLLFVFTCLIVVWSRVNGDVDDEVLRQGYWRPPEHGGDPVYEAKRRAFASCTLSCLDDFQEDEDYTHSYTQFVNKVTSSKKPSGQNWSSGNRPYNRDPNDKRRPAYSSPSRNPPEYDNKWPTGQSPYRGPESEAAEKTTEKPKTDVDYSMRGTCSAVGTSCGQFSQPTFCPSGGTVASMHFPNSYLPGTDCTYTIEAPDDKVVQIQFNTFKLGSTYTEAIAVYDEKSIQFLLPGALGFPHQHQHFSTATNTLKLNFVSDKDVPYHPSLQWGWNVTYTFIERTYCRAIGTGCGICSEPTNPSGGTIESFNYPDSYQADTNCDYIIYAPGKRIQTQYIRFQLDSKDNIQLFDPEPFRTDFGFNVTEVEDQEERQLPEVITTSDSLRMRFTVNAPPMPGYGWKARYRIL